MLYKYEGREWQQLFLGGAEFPQIIKLKSNKEYIREVISNTVKNSAKGLDILPLDALDNSADFFKYQKQVNSNVNSVPSHAVIDKFIKRHGEDYRKEDKPSSEKALRDRTQDNTTLARVREK